MKKRIISALLMILLFVPLLVIGKIPYCVFCAIVGLLALKEMFDLEKNIPNYMKIISYFIGLFLIIYNYNDRSLFSMFDYQIMGVLFLLYATSVVISKSLKKYNYKDALWLMIVTFSIGLLFNSFIKIRNYGIETVIYLLLIPIMTDTFALICGKYFGKHKLSEISPNKTVEGSIGGSIIGTIIPVLYVVLLTDIQTKVVSLVLVTFVLTLVGQIGDLFFSAIKRHYKVKDFSNLIPGHGGILDRMDSMLFVVLGYLIFSL